MCLRPLIVACLVAIAVAHPSVQKCITFGNTGYLLTSSFKGYSDHSSPWSDLREKIGEIQDAYDGLPDLEPAVIIDEAVNCALTNNLRSATGPDVGFAAFRTSQTDIYEFASDYEGANILQNTFWRHNEPNNWKNGRPQTDISAANCPFKFSEWQGVLRKDGGWNDVNPASRAMPWLLETTLSHDALNDALGMTCEVIPEAECIYGSKFDSQRHSVANLDNIIKRKFTYGGHSYIVFQPEVYTRPDDQGFRLSVMDYLRVALTEKYADADCGLQTGCNNLRTGSPAPGVSLPDTFTNWAGYRAPWYPAMIETEAENRMLRAEAANKFSYRPLFGLTDRFDERGNSHDGWTDPDGFKQPNFQRWGRNEPNDWPLTTHVPGEDFTQLTSWGEWNDHGGRESNRFSAIYEFDCVLAGFEEVTFDYSVDPTCPGGHVWFNKDTGKSYKLTMSETTFQLANQEALAAGGNLVVFNDLAEHEYVRDYILGGRDGVLARKRIWTGYNVELQVGSGNPVHTWPLKVEGSNSPAPAFRRWCGTNTGFPKSNQQEPNNWPRGVGKETRVLFNWRGTDDDGTPDRSAGQGCWNDIEPRSNNKFYGLIEIDGFAAPVPGNQEACKCFDCDDAIVPQCHQAGCAVNGQGNPHCQITPVSEGTMCNDGDSETANDKCTMRNGEFGCFGKELSWWCMSTGDPHISHSENGDFNFHERGNWVFMDITNPASGFDTQFFTNHWACVIRESSKASCNDDLRIKHGQYSVRLFADSDGPKVAMFPGAAPSNEVYNAEDYDHSALNYRDMLDGYWVQNGNVRTCATSGAAYDAKALAQKPKECGVITTGNHFNGKLTVERYQRTSTPGGRFSEATYLGKAIRFTVGAMELVVWDYHWKGAKAPYLNYQATWTADSRPPGISGICSATPPPPSPPCEFETPEDRCAAAKCCKGVGNYDACMDDMCAVLPLSAEQLITGWASEYCCASVFTEAEETTGGVCAPPPVLPEECDVEVPPPNPDCVDRCPISQRTLYGGDMGADTPPSHPSFKMYKVNKKMKTFGEASMKAASQFAELFTPADLAEFNYVVNGLLEPEDNQLAASVWLGYVGGDFAGSEVLPQSDGGAANAQNAAINSNIEFERTVAGAENPKLCYVTVFPNKDKDGDGNDDCALTEDQTDCDCDDSDASVFSGAALCCHSGPDADCNCDGTADALSETCLNIPDPVCLAENCEGVQHITDGEYFDLVPGIIDAGSHDAQPDGVVSMSISPSRVGAGVHDVCLLVTDEDMNEASCCGQVTVCPVDMDLVATLSDPADVSQDPSNPREVDGRVDIPFDFGLFPTDDADDMIEATIKVSSTAVDTGILPARALSFSFPASDDVEGEGTFKANQVAVLKGTASALKAVMEKSSLITPEVQSDAPIPFLIKYRVEFQRLANVPRCLGKLSENPVAPEQQTAIRFTAQGIQCAADATGTCLFVADDCPLNPPNWASASNGLTPEQLNGLTALNAACCGDVDDSMSLYFKLMPQCATPCAEADCSDKPNCYPADPTAQCVAEL